MLSKCQILSIVIINLNTLSNRQTGMLVLNKKKNAPSLVSTRQALVNHGLPFEDLTPEQLKTRYPLMSYKGHFDCLLDVEAGFLIANKCHQILQVGFTFASWGGGERSSMSIYSIGRII